MTTRKHFLIAAKLAIAAIVVGGSAFAVLSAEGHGWTVPMGNGYTHRTMNEQVMSGWEATCGAVIAGEATAAALSDCAEYIAGTGPGNLLFEASDGKSGVQAVTQNAYRGYVAKLIPIQGSAVLLLQGSEVPFIVPTDAYACLWTTAEPPAIVNFTPAQTPQPSKANCSASVNVTQVGAFNVTLKVTYAQSSFSTVNTTVTAAPEFTLVPKATQFVTEGTNLAFNVIVNPPTANVTAPGIPSSATFTANAFSWEPDFNANGTHVLTFRAAVDGIDGINTEVDVSVVVRDNNRKPVVAVRNASATVGHESTLDAAQGTLFNFTINATDLDAEDPLSIVFEANSKIQNGSTPRGTLFQNVTDDTSPAGAEFAWTPDWNAFGMQYLNFTAGDDKDVTYHNFTVNVTRSPPILTLSRAGIPVQNKGTIHITEGETLSLVISVQPNATMAFNRTGQLLNQNWTLDNQVHGKASFVRTATNMAGATGANYTLTWTPNLTANETGTFPLGFNAAKTLLTGYANVSVVVANYNEPPVITVRKGWDGPEMYASQTSGPLVHRQREFLNFTVIASDVDVDDSPVLGDFVTDIPNGTVPLKDIYNKTTGEFTWQPDWDVLGDYYYNFTANFTAAPGSPQVWRNLTVRVAAAPATLQLPPGPYTGMENKTYTLNLTVTPPETSVVNVVGLNTFRNKEGGAATFERSADPAPPGQWTFTWTPNSTSNGTYTLPFKATRSGAVAELNATVVIARFNNKPEVQLENATGIVFGPAISLPEDNANQVFMNVTEKDDADVLTLALQTNLTSAAYSFNNTNGVLDLHPPLGSAGKYYVNFTASDTKEVGWANVTLDVLLKPAKLFVPASPLIIDENARLEFNVSVQPADLNITFNGSLAMFPNHKAGFANFTRTGANWTFTWTPNSTSNATHELRFNATRAGNVTDAVVTVIVAEANRPPELAMKNETGDSLGTLTVPENGHLRFRAIGSDTDPTDELVYSVKSNITSAAFSLNATTGWFDLAPPYGTVGSYYANFTVTDAHDDVWENVTFTVTKAPARLVAPSATVHGFEETTLTVNVSVQPEIPVLFNGSLGDFPDHHGGNATWTNVGPNWTFTWTPNTTANMTANGTYMLRFNATRLGMTTDTNVTLKIAHLNHAPALHVTNETGAVVPTGSTLSWPEDSTLRLALAVTDDDWEDNTNLLAGAALPQGAKFQSVTNFLDRRSTGTFEWKPGAESLGFHNLSFAARDHQAITFYYLTVHVVNAGPALLVPSIVQGAENQTLSFNVSSAPDVPISVQSLASFPNAGGGIATLADTGANWTFTWTPNFTANGTHNLVFSGTSKGATTNATVTIQVADTNRPPIASVSSQGVARKSFQVKPTETLSLLVFATDEDGHAIQVNRSTDIPSLGVKTDMVTSENSAAAVFRYLEWTPTAEQLGRYFLNVSVKDATSASFVNATITVVAPGPMDAAKIPTQSVPASVFVSPMPVSALYDLAYALDMDEPLHDVILLDLDGDGSFESLSEPTGRLRSLHVAPSLAVYLVRDDWTNNLAIYNSSSFEAAKVTEITNAAIEIEDNGTNEVMGVSITIPQKDGWIVIVFPDSFSGLELGKVVRADGTPVPAELVWRAQSNVYILDDPAATYYMELMAPLGVDEGGHTAAWRFVWMGTGLLVLLAVGAGGAWWVRRRNAVASEE